MGQQVGGAPPGGWGPANIPQFLEGIDFPKDRQGLLRHAEQKGAPEEIRRFLQTMTERTYTNMADVMKGVGEARHH
ncbi:MAG: DUF2795 domain-containing protein [Chloroflexi bacterium]|nr:DUF2795 domain-containing protein [Chloroflexota bacterium]